MAYYQRLDIETNAINKFTIKAFYIIAIDDMN